MECPCEKGSFNHSIYHNVVKESIKWMNVPIVIKISQPALHMSHIISLFTCHLKEGKDNSPSQDKLYSVFCPVRQATCPFRKTLLCVRIMYSSRF